MSDFLLTMVIRFFENVASPARGEIAYLATLVQAMLVLSRDKFITLNFSRIFFSDFSAVASHVQCSAIFCDWIEYRHLCRQASR